MIETTWGNSFHLKIAKFPFPERTSLLLELPPALILFCNLEALVF